MCLISVRLWQARSGIAWRGSCVSKHKHPEQHMRSPLCSAALVVAGLSLPVTGFLPSTTPSLNVPGATRSSYGRRARVGATMAAEGAGAGSRPVVVGYPGGVAELIAQKLKQSHEGAQVKVFFEREGASTEAGLLSGMKGVEVISTDLKALSKEDLASATSVFVSLDAGHEKETGSDPSKYTPLPGILEKLPSSVPLIVAAYANDTAPGTSSLPMRLFGGGVNPREAVESARGSSSSRKAVVVQHGRLFGYMPGKEPLPFVSAPLQAPVIDEAFSKQGMLLSLGTTLSRNPGAATLRNALADCMVRVVDRLETVKDFSIVSLEGSKPSDADWEPQLSVIDTSGGVTVFEKALDAKDSKVDLKTLQTWLQDDFSSSLSNLAIARVLNSPKPTRLKTTANGGDLVWQYIDKDLNIRDTGKWSITLDQTKDVPTLKVLRVDASGDMLTEPLPGEQEVIQRLSELLGKLIYSKLSKKRSSSV